MSDLRFNERVHCAGCGYDTGITRSELFEKMNFNCPRCHFTIKRSEPEKPQEPEKTCPFRFIGYQANPMGNRTTGDCQKEKCAVWSVEYNCCGIVAISKENWSK